MREHYAITLMKTEGETVTLFINHMVSLRPQKDGTCIVQMIMDEHHVRESEDTIVNKCKSHNVIIKVGGI